MTVLRNNHIAIVGQGYVGLPLAMQAYRCGFRVLGIEENESRLQSLNSGISYIEDVESVDLQAAINSGFYRATFDYAEVSECSVIIVCVPTPITKEKIPDLSYLVNAMKSIAKYVTKDTLLVSESTSYPGTLRHVIEPIFAEASEVFSKLFFAVAPERINPGGTDFLSVPRVVSGLDVESSKRVVHLYSRLGFRVMLSSSPEIAEASKLLENTFRQVNIALVNEFAKIMHQLQIDTREVIEMAATKPYGFMKFSPGPGVGGHCIPVDPYYLVWAAAQVNYESDFILNASKINENMPSYVVSRVEELLDKKLDGKQVLIVGLAYKEGVSDLRESPALELIEKFKSKGCSVSWYDERVQEFGGETASSLNAIYDVVVISLSHLELPIGAWVEAGTVIFDCTGYYSGAPSVNQL